jgi:hypothetical protein
VGSADLVGVLTVSVYLNQVDAELGCETDLGRFFALEVKRPGEKPTEEQVRWLSTVRDGGGFAAVVHSEEEAVAALERAKEGRCE